MISRKIIWNVQMCDSSIRTDCKNETDIKEYSKDVTIEEWLI